MHGTEIIKWYKIQLGKKYELDEITNNPYFSDSSSKHSTIVGSINESWGVDSLEWNHTKKIVNAWTGATNGFDARRLFIV